MSSPILLEVLGTVVAFLLYPMLGVPFIIWSSRGALASARARAAADPARPVMPGLAATFWLAVLPFLIIGYYFLSDIGATSVEEVDIGPAVVRRTVQSEWAPVLFLCLPPAFGSIFGYVIGTHMAQKARP